MRAESVLKCVRGSISSRSNIGDRPDADRRIDTYHSTDRPSSSAIVPAIALGVPLLAVLGIVLSVAPVFAAVIAAIATVAALSVTVPRGIVRVAEVVRKQVGSARQPDRTSDESTGTSGVSQTAD
jgi:hypothetical protein